MGHKPQIAFTTTTTDKRQRLTVPTKLQSDPALASSQKLQRYLERGDVVRPKAATTVISEIAGRRSKVRAAELFTSTTERLCKKFRPSLTCLTGANAAGNVDGDRLHINLNSSSKVFL